MKKQALSIKFKSAQPAFQLRNTTLAWVLINLGLVIAPHLQHISWVAILISGGLILWRWLIAQQQWALPKAWVRLLLAVSAFIIVVGQNSIFGRDSGVTLLVIMVGLKLLETQDLRGIMVILFLSYFLVVTHCLYSQELLWMMYLAGIVVLTTMIMIDVNHMGPTPWHWSVHWRITWQLLLPALPLALLLFVVFPRLSGPLWGLPTEKSVVTGLSNEMRPGSVSQLSQSNAVAFRVKFDGPVPDADQRYWRGPVFEETDGISWRADEYLRYTPEQIIITEKYHFWRYPGVQRLEPSIDYTVTLEPHQQRWLLALDLPYGIPQDARLSRSFQVMADQVVSQRKRYRVRSHLNYQTGPLSDWEHYKTTVLPPLGPRVMALVNHWRMQAGDQDQEIVRLALQYFRQHHFVYSLNPPLLGQLPTDEFLFETRTGFCEHYAAAFTLLMRAAQIPARVVTGYQGGQVNPVDGYLTVHQADAHAWSEVWLPNQGWKRVDPTAAILPERIHLGLQESLERRGQADMPLARQVTTQLLAKITQGLRQTWDAVNNAWYENVLGFGPERQQDFWAHFGLVKVSWATLGLLLGVLLGGSLLLLSGYLFWQGRRQAIASVRYYQRYCQRLASIGWVRAPSEPPLAFAQRVIANRPDLADAVQQITQLYLQLRYPVSEGDGQGGRRKQRQRIEQLLKRRVSAFRPSRM